MMTVLVAAEPEQLRRAAKQVRFVAEQVSRSVTARGGGLSVPAQRGWRSTGELDQAAGAWVQYLGDLAAAIEEMADNLGTVAATLAAAEAEAAARWYTAERTGGARLAAVPR